LVGVLSEIPKYLYYLKPGFHGGSRVGVNFCRSRFYIQDREWLEERKADRRPHGGRSQWIQKRTCRVLRGVEKPHSIRMKHLPTLKMNVKTKVFVAHNSFRTTRPDHAGR